MTAPVTHGYPDFGRYLAQADKFLTHIDVVNLNGTETHGPFFVGDVPAIGIFGVASANNMRVRFNFYGDSAGVTIFTSEVIDINNGDTAEFSIPTHGPWMYINIINGVGAASGLFDIWTEHIPRRPQANASTWNVLFSAVDTVYAAGQTLVNGGIVLPGRAIFTVDCTAANTFIDLRSIDYGGTALFLSRNNNASGIQDRIVYLPATHLQLRIQNNSGAAQVFSYTLLADPGQW